LDVWSEWELTVEEELLLFCSTAIDARELTVEEELLCTSTAIDATASEDLVRRGPSGRHHCCHLQFSLTLYEHHIWA
jgi:hypothetical protein